MITLRHHFFGIEDHLEGVKLVCKSFNLLILRYFYTKS